VEVKYNGAWGTICSIGMGPKTANVICNGLGYGEGGIGKVKGGGIGPIWLSRIQCKGNEADVGDCPRTCGGYKCQHNLDVGVCCSGFAIGKRGRRKQKRESFHTVRSLQGACYEPKSCAAAFGDLVVLGASDGNPNTDKVWKAKLGIGEWAQFGDGVCTSDSDMCVLKRCPIENNQLTSMYIPEGMKVTLFVQQDFKGRVKIHKKSEQINCTSLFQPVN
jgi:hypothetical protein